jgi:hypothetical protein
MKTEQDGHCPFLDIDINRPDGSIGNEMYCKPTLTNLYLNSPQQLAPIQHACCVSETLWPGKSYAELGVLISIFRQNSHSN